MAYETPRIISVSGRTIKIAHLDLPSQPLTYLLSATAATDTSFTVLDNVGFADTNLVLIGELGREQTEIKKVNAAVTSGTAMTLTTTTFPHPSGSPLRRVLFNQWIIYGNSTNTTVGATSVATVDMQVNAPNTTYVNTSTEYAYYFVVPYDSINSVTGDAYSDGVSKTTGYAPTSVGSLIVSALDSTRKEKGGIITDEWFMREINDCLRFVSGKLKHWSTLESFNYPLGQTSRGNFSFSMPSDIEDPNSIKSILSVRVGGGTNLKYIDKRELNNQNLELAITQVTTQATSGQTTLAINNSYDFADSGSVDVFISGTKYTITYTSVTRSTTAGVLNGVPASGTGSISVTIPVGTYVFQNAIEGTPSYFTVFDGLLQISPMPDTSSDNQNVYLDYFTSRTLVNSAGDIIETQRYDMVKHWLCFKLRSLDNASGKLDLQDGDWAMFNTILTDNIKKETTSQKHKMKFNVNRISY